MRESSFSWARWCRRGLAGIVLGLAMGPVANVHADTLLIVGDSLSAAHGIEREAGWVALLRERVGDAHEVVNASISGDTTSGGAARLPDLLERHSPDIVLLELGGNDGLRGLSPQQMKLNLRTMIEKSQAADARVLLLGIEIPPNYGAAYTDAFRGVFRQLSEEYAVPLVPFILDGVALQDDMMQEDGIHPNAAAQPIILDNVWEKLGPMLSRDTDRNECPVRGFPAPCACLASHVDRASSQANAFLTRRRCLRARG